ncbi:Sau3AI family type II restriction endonuclease [Clostridium baratii]|uniref:Sau3AI family type II restriction endonuclease n=1 Tax=Clostridium baratii TaxID=1561 RepID=UPI00374FA61B
MIFKTEKQLLEYTKNILGKKFKEIDVLGLLKSGKKDKGILGKVVETGFYKYPLNNNPVCDFNNLGIELKVTGFKRNKRNISAKERVSLSMINYNTIINEQFEFSKLIFKNKRILFIWYEYDNQNKEDWGEFKICYYQLYDMGVDEAIFRNDFNIIKSMVADGQAHELSEGKTSYLGAATKGKDSKDVVEQPNSNILAMKRAFSLKNSYMTGVLRSINSKITAPTRVKTVEEYLINNLQPYLGMKQIDIWEKISGKKINGNIPKNLSKMISDRLIGKDKELPKIDDIFTKTNYIIKNTSLNPNGYPIERIAFRNLTITEFEKPWETSEWKSYYEEATILLICYEGSKKEKNGFRKLKGVEKIVFTADDLNKFKLSYDAVRETIKSKDIVNLPRPKSFENQILEIAPKGIKGDDAYNNFFETDTTRTCFMLEKEFVYRKLNKKSYPTKENSDIS